MTPRSWIVAGVAGLLGFLLGAITFGGGSSQESDLREENANLRAQVKLLESEIEEINAVLSGSAK